MFNDKIEQILKDFAQLENFDKSDIEIYVFPQNWGNTALGYRGVGGQAMTSSHTIVFYNPNTGNAMFSYGGRFIRLNNPNDLFFKDIANGNLEPEYKLGKYRRNING